MLAFGALQAVSIAADSATYALVAQNYMLRTVLVLMSGVMVCAWLGKS